MNHINWPPNINKQNHTWKQNKEEPVSFIKHYNTQHKNIAPEMSRSTDMFFFFMTNTNHSNDTKNQPINLK